MARQWVEEVTRSRHPEGDINQESFCFLVCEMVKLMLVTYLILRYKPVIDRLMISRVQYSNCEV